MAQLVSIPSNTNGGATRVPGTVDAVINPDTTLTVLDIVGSGVLYHINATGWAINVPNIIVEVTVDGVVYNLTIDTFRSYWWGYYGGYYGEYYYGVPWGSFNNGFFQQLMFNSSLKIRLINTGNYYHALVYVNYGLN